MCALMLYNGRLYQLEAARSERRTSAASLARSSFKMEDINLVSFRRGVGAPEIRYEKTNAGWRMPQFENAFADQSQVESLIEGLAAAKAVPVNMRGKSYDWFGLGSKSIELSLKKDDETKMQLICGAALPGMWGGDSYARLPDSNAVWHINTNPGAALAERDNLPPMIDARVIPSSFFTASEISKIVFEPGGEGGGFSVERRMRTLSQEEMETLPPPMRELVYYDWFAITPDGKKLPLDEKQVGMFTGYLQNLAYTGVAPKERATAIIRSGPQKGMRITFNKRLQGGSSINRQERLDMFLSGSGATRYLIFSGNGIMVEMRADNARYLFPTIEFLANPLKTQDGSVVPAPPMPPMGF